MSANDVPAVAIARRFRSVSLFFPARYMGRGMKSGRNTASMGRTDSTKAGAAACTAAASTACVATSTAAWGSDIISISPQIGIPRNSFTATWASASGVNGRFARAPSMSIAIVVTMIGPSIIHGASSYSDSPSKGFLKNAL